MPDSSSDSLAKIPVLFDTDIGNDIDDAVALAYLLRQSRCELLGITTVSGDTKKRASLADALCLAAGRTDIPIHAGLTGPLLHGRGQPEVPQYDAIASGPHRTDFPENTAVTFLRDSIRARPGEITLLAVGPMTNVGVLFALDPEIPALLKKIVLMCGVFTGVVGHGPGAREWNALIDPTATALTYDRGAGNLVSVGLDVTTQCKMDRAECRETFAAAGQPLASTLPLAEVWFSHAKEITFHDPLAAALIFEPSLCGLERGRIETFVDAGPLEGLTRFTRAADGGHEVATTVDAAAFFEHYFAVAGAPPGQIPGESPG